METAMKAHSMLRACQNKVCKKEMDALAAKSVVHQKKIGDLMKKLMSKKIDSVVFKKELKKLTMEMKQWKESGDVMACSATNCNKEMYNGLNMAVANMEKACAGASAGKRDCQATVKKLKAILAKKTLTVAEFKEIQSIITQYSLKLMK